MRNSSNLWIAAFIGITMILSVFGFAFLQGDGGLQTAPQTEELPDNYIIDYQLTPQQRQTLIVDYGRTLIDFAYDPDDCLECQELIPLLESITHQFSDQIILSKIEVSSQDYVDLPRLFMVSSIASWSQKGTEINKNEIEQGFCAVVLYPPIGCTLKPQTNSS